MDIDWNRAVLLPIDMQQAFDAAPWPPRWNGKVDENGLALLRRWREAGRPIVHVRHDSVMDGSSLAPGSEGNRFRPGFEPLEGEALVTKSVNSAFIGTDLDLRLRRLGARHVIARVDHGPHRRQLGLGHGAGRRRLRLFRPSRREWRCYSCGDRSGRACSHARL